MKKFRFFTALCCAILCNIRCADAQNYHMCVDLGLSVKWATCNVGATKPEEYGNYYAWGETQTKRVYSQNNYKYGTYDGDFCTLTKYTVTDGVTLIATDDAASVNWGGTWRMPTIAEWQELGNNCSWTRTTLNGVNGYKVKSKVNGNTIFLPAAGSRNGSSLDGDGDAGYYWSSSLNMRFPCGAWRMLFSSWTTDRVGGYRYYGCTIRPVCE